MSRVLLRPVCALPSLRTHFSQSPASCRGLSWLPAFLGDGSSGHPAAKAQHIALGPERLVDPYSWLSDYNQARDYIRQEQTRSNKAAQRLARLQQQLLSELRQHVRAHQTDDPAEADGPYLYRTTFSPAGSQTVTRVSSSCPDQPEQVVVSDDLIHTDLAQAPVLTADLQGGVLTTLKLSRDQQQVAYGVASSTGEQQACIVRDLHTGAVVRGMVLPAVTSFEWSADASTLYYTTVDDTGRPSRVFCRRRGVPGDRLVFEEGDVKHFITLTRSKDWRYVLINSTSKLSTEVHLLDALDVSAAPLCVQPRQPGLEYFVEHHQGHLLLLTNLTRTQQQAVATSSTQQQVQEPSNSSAADYSLYTMPVAGLQAGSSSSLQHWQLLKAELPGSAVTDMDVFAGAVVLHTLLDSRPSLLVLNLAEPEGSSKGGALAVGHQYQVQLPDWALWLRPGVNGDYSSTSFRLYASSPAHPEVSLQLDLSAGTLVREGERHTPAASSPQHQQHHQQQQHRQNTASSIQPLDCGMVSQRLWAQAADGTAVPLTLLHKAGLPLEGPRPLLVEVYGAYGHVLESDFKPHRLPLLDRGWSVVLAHVRGGGELGRRWHAAGRQLQKHHSVTDLLAVLQHLVDLGVTAPGLVAGHAASAGGLTLAAAINAQPGLFSAAVLEAPFVDWVAGTGAVNQAGQPLVGEHLLTQHETDEWGDPWADAAVAQMIAALCPYTNLRPGVQYPAMLLTAGLADSRVPWWMPVKYAAKMRSMQDRGTRSSSDSRHGGRAGSGVVEEVGASAELLLQFDETGSHFSMGLSGGDLQDAALQQAFLLTHTQTP